MSSDSWKRSVFRSRWRRRRLRWTPTDSLKSGRGQDGRLYGAVNLRPAVEPEVVAAVTIVRHHEQPLPRRKMRCRHVILKRGLKRRRSQSP